MSPCPAATYGMPPNNSGSHSGTWPSRCHHSAPHVLEAYPAGFWSLPGAPSHWPPSIGRARIATHSVNSPAATRLGRLGSYTRVLLGACGDEHRGERRDGLAQRQHHPRADAQRHRPAAAERRSEQPDEDELAHAHAPRSEQRQQAQNVAEGEYARGGRDGKAAREPEAEGEQP